MISSSLSPPSLMKEARELEDEVISLRRKVHQNPELSYHEEETAELVAGKLRSLGIDVKTGVGGTGVVGLLKGGDGPGAVVGLRADMDALPVEELSDVEFKSRVKGTMHACGHDSHVAMLLGTAMILAKHGDELSGAVKFLFQPAEEHGGKGGAKPMIEEGAMEKPKVDYVFGLHIMYDYPSGTFALREGNLLAAPDSFKIRIIGKGGHGSAPHQAVDPVYAAAQVVTSLQGLSGRMVDPVEPFVISVCSIHSGTRHNIIPDEAVLEGTLRTLNERTRSEAKSAISAVAKAVCGAFGAKCDVDFMEDAYPITRNDPAVTKTVLQVLRSIKGTKTVEASPILGGEDFSRFLEKAPGTFYFLGTRNVGKGCVYPNHSARFKIDEDVLKYGSTSLALLALEFTRRGRKGSESFL